VGPRLPPPHDASQHRTTCTLVFTQGAQDWEQFCSILPNKKAILFEYQTISLYREPVPAKHWAQEEDDLFLSLIKYNQIYSEKKMENTSGASSPRNCISDPTVNISARPSNAVNVG
jgi:hypothetical protein